MKMTVAMCVAFSIGAGVCWLVALLTRLGRFPRNRWLGVSTDATQSSDEAWHRAHAAAARWIVGAAAATTVAALLCGVSLALGPRSYLGLVLETVGFVLGLSSIVACGYRARVVANRAARSDG